MLEQLVQHVPAEATRTATMLASASALVGLVLWLAGARMGRSVIALIAVALGAWLGLQLPRWLDLPVSSWATATAGALVLGMSAYAGSRLWTTVGLALLLALWGAVGVVHHYSPKTGAELLDWPDKTSLVKHITEVWDDMPTALRQVGPAVCGVAAAIGLAVGVFLPRLGTGLFFSLLGMSVMIVCGGVAMSLSQPQLLDRMPEQHGTQLAILAGLVLGGALVQLRLLRKPKAKAVAKAAKPA